jgi:hypothetical protein
MADSSAPGSTTAPPQRDLPLPGSWPPPLAHCGDPLTRKYSPPRNDYANRYSTSSKPPQRQQATAKEGTVTPSWVGRVPQLKPSQYADGMPIHKPEYICCKLILRPNKFHSRESFLVAREFSHPHFPAMRFSPNFGLGITDAPQPLLYNRRQIQQPRQNL